MKKNVYVAMSGGIDSSLAAYLLKMEGYQVIGITLQLWDGQSSSMFDDAKEAARRIGIEHHVLDARADFDHRVMSLFCREYGCGKTPNPCVVCNAEIKFGILLDWVLLQGGDFLASGHYARIQHEPISGRYSLHKAVDIKKDQSYMLWQLNQRQLAHLLFPLGDYLKEDIRTLANEKNITAPDKAESQEICFIPDNQYTNFLEARQSGGRTAGDICFLDGTVVGQHPGVAFYTVGQRKNMGIAVGYPLYVIRIDSATNRIFVGKREEGYSNTVNLEHVHFIEDHQTEKERQVQAKIRYNMREASAKLICKGDGFYQLQFREPQWAVTPGQSAVFYDKDRLIGGGIII